MRGVGNYPTLQKFPRLPKNIYKLFIFKFATQKFLVDLDVKSKVR